jgi:Iron-containing redox enzyme
LDIAIQMACQINIHTPDWGPLLVQTVCLMVVILPPVYLYLKARKSTRKVSYTFTKTFTPTSRCFHDSIDYYRDLYFKLQNIEEHPKILPEARRLLLSLLSEAITASEKNRHRGIFAIKHYTEEGFFAFLRSSHRDVGDACQRYLHERKTGSPRILLDRRHAITVLAQLAPIKLVDGAWLRYIHQIATPFDLRPITRQLWQVLSEELGDGNLHRNHVEIYRRLIQELGVDLPSTHTSDFIDSHQEWHSVWVFKAAVTQLLISLFPLELLPEILGFNLHFETLTLETFILAKELQELGVNAHYFLLHISIDNADSGHACMAAQTVARYLSQVERDQGSGAMQAAWRRVKAGYALSAFHSRNQGWPPSPITESITKASDRYEKEVCRLLLAKATVSQKLHYACPVKIGGQTLSQWLDPTLLASEPRQLEFLRELSTSTPWVTRGNAEKSRLIRAMRWGGKMFGAFTQNEVELLENWINSLQPYDLKRVRYCEFSDLSYLGLDKDITDSETVDPYDDTDFSRIPIHNCSFVPGPPIELPKCWTSLIPLWFTHPCLLESYIAIPSCAATGLGSAILHILRAQKGFSEVGDGVLGTDEAKRADGSDLISLGLEILSYQGIRHLPTSLTDILAKWPYPFAQQMLCASRSPIRNIEVMLGMSLAFVDLQRAVAASSTLLSDPHRRTLEVIISREVEGLDTCRDLLKSDEHKFRRFSAGYQMVREEIDRILRSN